MRGLLNHFGGKEMKIKEIDEILKKIPNEKQNEARLVSQKLIYLEEKLQELQKSIDETGVVEQKAKKLYRKKK